MFRIKSRWISVLSVLLVASAPAAQAQWAVIDVGAIAQLMQQILTMKEQLDTAKTQLDTAKNQLTQAKSEFDSMTGGRGMQNLLSGIPRNYLPTNWSELDSALKGAAGAYGAIAGELKNAIETNAILTTEQIAGLSPAERAQLEAARASAALLQVTAREALATTSQRFASIQQLIAAIPTATDQKAILDLQARISVEQGMLQNDQTKLDTLYQVVQAQELARRQRAREQAIADIGSFRDLPPLGL